MIVNQQSKTANAIAFFAIRYKDRYGYWPAQMWIYKLLALLDYRILKATGRPCLGLDYLALDNGPVPSFLYDRRMASQDGEIYCFIPARDSRRIDVAAKQEPNMDYFSDRAAEEMERLADEFIDSGKDLAYLIDATHSLNAWRVARRIADQNHRGRVYMEYADEFPDDIASKSVEELSFQEESFLTWKKHSELELADACRQA